MARTHRSKGVMDHLQTSVGTEAAERSRPGSLSGAVGVYGLLVVGPQGGTGQECPGVGSALPRLGQDAPWGSACPLRTHPSRPRKGKAASSESAEHTVHLLSWSQGGVCGTPASALASWRSAACTAKAACLWQPHLGIAGSFLRGLPDLGVPPEGR